MWDDISVNILWDRKWDVVIPEGITQKLLNHIPCSHNSCLASSASRFSVQQRGQKTFHKPNHEGWLTHAKTSPPPWPCPTWATSHLPALVLQACWLHFWNSGGLSSWSQRHWWSSVVLFSEGIQRTALFWEPPPQEVVHWKRHRKSHSSSRMLPREHL